jgi:hypothetical protein
VRLKLSSTGHASRVQSCTTPKSPSRSLLFPKTFIRPDSPPVSPYPLFSSSFSSSPSCTLNFTSFAQAVAGEPAALSVIVRYFPAGHVVGDTLALRPTTKHRPLPASSLVLFSWVRQSRTWRLEEARST